MPEKVWTADDIVEQLDLPNGVLPVPVVHACIRMSFWIGVRAGLLVGLLVALAAIGAALYL